MLTQFYVAICRHLATISLKDYGERTYVSRFVNFLCMFEQLKSSNVQTCFVRLEIKTYVYVLYRG